MMIPKSMLGETAEIKSLTGNSAVGPVFGATAQAACYLQPGTKRITNARGEELTASAKAIFLPDVQIKIGDAVIWQGTFYQVVDVRQMRWNGQTHHLEVYLTSEAGQC